MVIRAPNHLGDFVMALPALRAAAPTAVVVPRWLAPLAELAGFTTIPFDRGTAGLARAILDLRRRRFSRGILLTPSFSSALMLRLGGVRTRRGTNTDHRRFLLTSIVDRRLIAHTHRSSVYMLLATGEMPRQRPVPSLHVPQPLRAGFRALVGTPERLIGIFPGSNAPSRTWDAMRFHTVAQQLAAGARVVVFGGPAETERTRAVAGEVAIDLGGQTGLPLLAAGLAECDLVISNDSGPLHLAAAVGSHTISLWGAGDPSETGPPPGHTVIRPQELPCLECVKNVCPRRGKGFFLADAYMECLQLITPEQVIAAAAVPERK